MAFGLIASLLPGCAATQDLSTREARAEEAVSNSQIHHREHNLLLDAKRSGNMALFNAGIRGEGTPDHLVYDFKKQVVLDFIGYQNRPDKRLWIRAHWYEYGVKKDADLGVVAEGNAAYWMAEWTVPVAANFIALTGSYPNEPQPNTAWKIELRSNGQWRVHERGVGGWYDRGRYVWGGRDVKPVHFDGLRVSLFSKDSATRLKNIHFCAEENVSWMVAFLPPIDAQIVVQTQVPRAGEVVEFAGKPVFGTVQSWQWNFGDGKSATGQTVAHTFGKAGTYNVVLTLSGAGHTVNIVEQVTIHPAVEAQITPSPGSVLEGQSVTFDGSNSYGAIDTYHWDFGDGSTATGKQVTKSFSRAGIYQVTLRVSNSTENNSCSALVRVHTPATVKVPQVMLDTDGEEDDLYYIAYALFSELDVLGINSVHHGGEDPRQEPGNYALILRILDLAKKSGLPDARLPKVFHGAAGPLLPPYSDKWSDTEPIVTAASEAILAAARGASPDNPVWVLPVGPASNVASALLQVRRQGWESEFRKRIRVCWLGGSYDYASKGTWNGKRDPWAAYVIAQSGVEFLVMTENPAGDSLKIDRRVDGHLYPKNPLGDYLYKIAPDRNASWYDQSTVSAVIGIHLGKKWLTSVEPSTVLDRYQDYRWAKTDTPTNVHIIRTIDHAAMKKDFFDTLNGKPTALPPMRQKR
jgi:chitodextrinase